MDRIRDIYSQFPLWGDHKKKTSATDQIHKKGSTILKEVESGPQQPPKQAKQRTVKPIPKGEKEFKVKEKKVSRSQSRHSRRETHPPRPVKKIGKEAHLGPNVEKLDRMIQTIIESARGLIYEFLPKYDRLALSKKQDLLLPLFTLSECQQTLVAPFIAAKSWAKGTSEKRRGINGIQLVCGRIKAGEGWDSYNASIIHYAKRLHSYVSLSDQLSSPNEKESNVEQMTQGFPKLEEFTKIFFRSFVGLMIRDLKKTPYLQSLTVSLADALLTVECLVKDEHITDIDKFAKSEGYYTELKNSVLLQIIALKITKLSVSLLLDASLHIPLEQKEEFLIAHLFFFKRFKLPLGRRYSDKVSDPKDPVAMLNLALQSIRDDRKYLAKLEESNLNNISRIRITKSSVSIAPERPVKTALEEINTNDLRRDIFKN